MVSLFKLLIHYYLKKNSFQQTLEKKAEKFKGNAAQYDTFINQTHQWMLDNTRLALEMFKQFDSDGLISYDQFKAGKSVYENKIIN